MRVKRDFDRVYDEQADPWAIGAADDPRYDRYRRLLVSRAQGGRLLDIGCGLGAFLARFDDVFDELIGVETAGEAVRRARELWPGIEFVHAKRSDSPRQRSTADVRRHHPQRPADARRCDRPAAAWARARPR